ncbi:MAG TPA: DUF2007 domain-containing protein [Sphingobacteriaceae bacterium]
MNKDWHKIYTTSQAYKAEIVRQVLADHGIEAVILNQQDSSYRFGEIQVYVHGQHADEARAIVITNEL